MRHVLTLAHYVLLEARRGSLPWLALACVAIALAAAGFLSQVAIIEGRQTQAAVAGAFLRAGVMLIVALHVASSVARESSDKMIELALAFPVSRTQYYAGKLLGHAAAAALVAAFCALPMFIWVTGGTTLAWWLSLATEAALVAAAALFFGMALAQPAAAIAATLGFYLLARTMATIQAIAVGPVTEPTALAHASRWVLEAVAALLPRLDTVARTDWLVYGLPSTGDLGRALVECFLYVALLGAAGALDFSRRNL